MQLDIKSIMESADRIEKEKTRAFLEEIRGTNDEMSPLMGLLGEQIRKENRERAEREAEQAAAAAEEAVRAKYANEAPAEWNESETDRALKLVLQSLFTKSE